MASPVDRIYNLLDSGQDQAALKSCDQLLKKAAKKQKWTAQWQTVLSLKGITLVRLGKPKYAIELANEVAATQPSDEQAVQLCANVYRDAHRPECIPPLYENALKQDESEELFTHLFVAYLRNGDFANMKLTAMKLFKKYRKYQYLAWQVMCGYYQAQRGENSELNLKIARKLYESDLGDHGEGAHRLYLLILLEMGDLDSFEASLIESKFKRSIDGYKQMKLLLNEKRSNLSGIGSEMMNRLIEDDNDWGAWKQLIEVVIELDDQIKGDNGEEVLRRLTLDGTLTSIDALEQYISDKSKTSRARGPALARIELQTKCQPDQVDQLIVDYVKRFGHKQCCFGDLEAYLDSVQNSDTLISSAKVDLSINVDDNADSVACRHLMHYLLKSYFQCAHSDDVSLLIEAGIALHDAFKPTEQIQSLMDTEPRPWDRHFLLAAQLCLLSLETPDYHEALAILELGMTKTGFNSDLTLMALNLSMHLGCANRAYVLFHRLDIKSIQFDSMGYLCFPAFSQIHYANGCQLLDRALPFYGSANRDAIEQIITSFRNNTFDKITEMFAFRRACLDSSMRRLISIEKQLHDLLDGKVPDRLDLLTSNERDNRDLNALNMFIPKRSSIEVDLQAQSKAQMQMWSSIRERFAVTLCQTLTMTGVELIQVEGTLDELDQAINQYNIFKHDCATPIIATMIGVRAPFGGNGDFIALLALTARAIHALKSGVDNDAVNKLTAKLTELPTPSRCDEMSLVVDCLRAMALLMSDPLGDRAKAAARKSQAKLKEPEKLLLTSLRALFGAFGSIAELQLANENNYTASDNVLDATRKNVNETVTNELESACWRLNESKKELEERLTAHVTK